MKPTVSCVLNLIELALTYQKRHIASLYVFLNNIRRPYLDMSSRGHRTTERGEDGVQPHSPEIDGMFSKWQQVVSLTDAERDEIDFQVKLFVKQCLERVQELERGEKRTSPHGRTPANYQCGKKLLPGRWAARPRSLPLRSCREQRCSGNGVRQMSWPHTTPV